MNLLLLFIIFSSISVKAESICDQVGLCHKAIGERKLADTEKELPKNKKEIQPQKKMHKVALNIEGNLPLYYDGNFKPSKEGQTVLVPDRMLGPKLKGLNIGDILFAKISQSIKATSTTPSPIRAIIEDGEFAGSIMVGKASLDKNLKRILVDFTKIRVPKNDQVYTFNATAQGPSGQEGLEGEYHTEEGKFLLYDALAATTASFMDSTVQRNQNILGNSEQPTPTVSNNLKVGATSGLSEVTARMAEKAKNPPEYTELKDHAMIQVLVTDYAREEVNQ